MSYELRIVGKRLQYIREQLGLSRREIEEKYKVSANTLKAWELGKTEAGILKLVNYLDIFKEYKVHVSLDKIIKAESIDYPGIWFDKSNMLKEVSGREAFDLNYMVQSNPFLMKVKKDMALISDNLISILEMIFQEKEELFYPIFNALPIRIYYKDDQNNILRLNQGVAHGMGGIVSDFEGKNCYDLFSTAMAEKFHDDDLQIMESNIPKFNVIDKYRTKTGVEGWAKSAKIPFINRKTGKIIILGIVQDYSIK